MRLAIILYTLVLAVASTPVFAETGITVSKTFSVGSAPHGMRLDGDTVLIALSGEDAVVRIDLQTGKEVSRWPVKGVPLDIVRSKNGWLVTTFQGEHLIELDATTGEEISRWKVGKSPSLFSENLAAGHTYVVSEFADRFTVFDPTNNTVIKTYTTGKRPYPGDVTHDGVLAFVPNRSDNTVSVIDLLNETEVTRTPVCSSPEGGALVEGENTYMVACGGSDEIALINTASFEVITTIKDGIGKRPFAVTESSDGRFAFVNNASGDTVSVIDVKERAVIEQITVGTQPIVMRAYGNQLFVTTEVDGTLSILEIPPVPEKPRSTVKNEVVMLGMIHGGHTTSETYGLPYLTRVFEAVSPDYVLVEIPPNRMESTMKGFRETGEIQEPRTKRFPEYVGALFPLSRRLKFEMIGTAGWNSHMNDYRSKALRRIQNDPTRAADWAEYQAAIDKAAEARKGLEEDPYYINSDAYDAVTAWQLEPYDRLFNDEIGPGGWTKINQAHYSHIADALDKLSGQGKRVMITYGAGHKNWFMRELRKRDDIILLDPHQFLDAAKE
ncbi:YncE family protein [Kordiimonas aquimaris]|uniref:YncE family protein n=1 Tax=Kordiimonas aquimaris TaxID=707591 RepID=UPI0021CE9CB4|nr:YncE family protein [Kordiimonas aquimaris]